jgi:hypothetical protein
MGSPTSIRSTVAFLVCVVVATAASRGLAAPQQKKSAGDDADPPKSSAHDRSIDSSTDLADKPKAAAADANTSDPEPSESEEEVVTNVPEKKTVSSHDDAYGHQGQFNVRLGFGGGYRIVMRYDASPPCSTTLNDDGTLKTLNGFGAPLTLDAAIGYAPSAGIEPFLWGRFGLTHEKESNTSPLVILGAGLRFYSMSDAAFKFFVEPAVGVELEKGTSTQANQTYQYKTDLIVRFTLGPQLDISRNVGIYAAAGLTAGMLRSLQSWMDLHAGVQARFP